MRRLSAVCLPGGGAIEVLVVSEDGIDDGGAGVSDLGGEVLEFFVAPKNGFLNIGGG